MLEVKNLQKQFKGITAIRDVSFKLPPSGIFGIIGPNGAGKTTLFNLLTGFYQPTSGEILLDGQRIDTLGTNKIARLGIARTYQLIRLFKSLTVLENVMLGAQRLHESGILPMILQTASHKRNEKAMREQAESLLNEIGLYEKRHHLSGSLSYGQQRKLEIARALASNPKLILLDEPAAGMNGKEIDDLSEYLLSLNQQGRVRVLIIEHNVRMMMRICSEILVLNFGSKMACDTPANIQSNPEIIEAYIGKAAAHA